MVCVFEVCIFETPRAECKMTLRKLKTENNKDARHPIHRVRIPYSKFSSPKRVAMLTKVA